MPWRRINTENSVIRGSNLKVHKPPYWISVYLSDTFKTHMKHDKQSFCVANFRRGKDGAQLIIPYMVYFMKIDIRFSYNTEVFVSVSAKFKRQTLFQGISNFGNLEKIKSLNLASYFFLSWRLRRIFKMVKGSISLKETKKEIITKIWTLHGRESLHYEFFG